MVTSIQSGKDITSYIMPNDNIWPQFQKEARGGKGGRKGKEKKEDRKEILHPAPYDKIRLEYQRGKEGGTETRGQRDRAREKLDLFI